MYKAILAVVLSTVVFFVAAGSAEAAGSQSKLQNATKTATVQQTQLSQAEKYQAVNQNIDGVDHVQLKSAVRNQIKNTLMNQLRNVVQSSYKIGGGQVAE